MNDNVPQFVSSIAVLPVAENAATDVTLYSVKALDRDSGDNGRIRYELTVNPNGVFQIHPTSGDLSLQVWSGFWCVQKSLFFNLFLCSNLNQQLSSLY